MALVDYESSGESGADTTVPITSIKPKVKPTDSKPAFQKLVDSSNPGKIRLNLADSHSEVSHDERHEPPTKRTKLGESGFKDFNSFLPAPKRPITNADSGKGGLGKGVSLKTGATPAFTREPMEHPSTFHDDKQYPDTTDTGSDGKAYSTNDTIPVPHQGAANSEPSTVPQRKATIFKPLSVSRRPKLKKPPPNPISETQPSLPNAPVALFPSHRTENEKTSTSTSQTQLAEYQPLLFKPVSAKDDGATPAPEIDSAAADQSLPDEAQDTSLDAIATSLNLTASQKRQLLGRNASKSSSQAMKVTNFNTDAEYAANEALRQSGEAVQHQAVRPIAGGGKHSLKQLVSSAVGQKDALDEKFAEGSRNRKEGAGRYGW